MKLTNEEKELLDSVEKGEWQQIPDFTNESLRYKEIAKNTLLKNKRVNIRMTEWDLMQLQKKAL